MRRACALAAAIAAASIGCSSADGLGSTDAVGHLRARTLAGADLGFAYQVNLWSFGVVGGTGTASVWMVALKEQPVGAPSPVIVYRTNQTGSPYLCTRYFAGPDCSGTATLVPPLMGSACVYDGRMYRADFTAPPASISFLSREVPQWDPASFGLLAACSNVSGTSPPNVLPAIDAGPAAGPPGWIRLEPAD